MSPGLKKALIYISRLSAFALVTVLLGLVVLIFCFAPATNPGFLSGLLYRGNDQKTLSDLAKFARIFPGSEQSVKIYDTLAAAQPADEFKKLGLDNPEMITFKTADGVTLKGWYFKNSGADTFLVAYNGFGMRLPLLAGYIKMLKETGASVFLFDYRGLHESGVKFSPQTACVDGQAAYDYLTKDKKVDANHIIWLGRELGAYVALKTSAANAGCKALILEEPWTTVKNYSESVPGAVAMKLVPEWLYTDDCLNNLHLVKAAHPPILVVTSEPEITRSGDFYKGIAAPKSLLYVEDYAPQMLCPDLRQCAGRYGQRLKALVAGQSFPAGSEPTIAWRTDYQSAQAEALKSNKLLLADFGASWCAYCEKMDMTTYVDAAVVTEINQHYVPLKVDLEGKDAQALIAKSPFNGIPMVFILDGQGNLKKKIQGFVAPAEFLKRLAGI